jgi:SAM-dependent methyltransferase
VSVLDRIHGDYVHVRRVRVLAERLAAILPRDATVLDIGCGDGLLDEEVLRRRSDLSIRGIETQPRNDSPIPVEAFDGRTIPLADRSFDAVLLVDVLHHACDPMILLGEAARVSRRRIIIKDHLRQGLLAGPTLRFMDRVGNARHGVPLPHNYWSPLEWCAAFERLNLRVDTLYESLGLYPWPLGMLFDRSLHFLASLCKQSPS